MTSQVANRYAQALFDLAVEYDVADTMYSQIEDLSNVIYQNKELYSVLRSPLITKDDKKKVIDSIFEEKLDRYTLNFIKVLVDNDRTTEIKNVVEEYKRLLNERNNILEGVAITAIEMDKENLRALEEKLSSKYNKKVILENKIDESIIGGVVVKIGNEEIDSSVRNRLNTLRESLIEVK